MPRPPKPCIRCGALSTGTYCPQHTQATTTARGLGWAHQQAARALLAHATVCYWCGKPPTRHNPLTADHLRPRSRGGTSAPDNLVAAHLRCNSARGNRG